MSRSGGGIVRGMPSVPLRTMIILYKLHPGARSVLIIGKGEKTRGQNNSE